MSDHRSKRETDFDPDRHTSSGSLRGVADNQDAATVITSLRQQLSEAQADREDAERWRAFIGSSRIRFFGSAGPDATGYAHFGGEFWTGVPAEKCDSEIHECTRCNAAWLITYADTARAARTTPPASETRDTRPETQHGD